LQFPGGALPNQNPVGSDNLGRYVECPRWTHNLPSLEELRNPKGSRAAGACFLNERPIWGGASSGGKRHTWVSSRPRPVELKVRFCAVDGESCQAAPVQPRSCDAQGGTPAVGADSGASKLRFRLPMRYLEPSQQALRKD
jgi:hypothetical protein